MKFTCMYCGFPVDETDTGFWEDPTFPPSSDVARYCEESSDHLHHVDKRPSTPPAVKAQIAMLGVSRETEAAIEQLLVNEFYRGYMQCEADAIAEYDTDDGTITHYYEEKPR